MAKITRFAVLWEYDIPKKGPYCRINSCFALPLRSDGSAAEALCAWLRGSVASGWPRWPLARLANISTGDRWLDAPGAIALGTSSSWQGGEYFGSGTHQLRAGASGPRPSAARPVITARPGR